MKICNLFILLLLYKFFAKGAESASIIYTPKKLIEGVILNNILNESSIFSFYGNVDELELLQGVIAVHYDESIINNSYINSVYCIHYEYEGEFDVEDLRSKIPKQDPKNNICIRDKLIKSGNSTYYEHIFFKYISIEELKKRSHLVIIFNFDTQSSIKESTFNLVLCESNNYIYSQENFTKSIINIQNDAPKLIYYQIPKNNIDIDNTITIINYSNLPFTLYIGNITNDNNTIINQNTLYGDMLSIPFRKYKNVNYLVIEFFHVGSYNSTYISINVMPVTMIKNTREANEYSYQIINCNKFYYLFGILNENKNSYMYIETIYGKFDIYYTNDYKSMIENKRFYPYEENKISSNLLNMNSKLDSFMFKCQTPGLIKFNIFDQKIYSLQNKYRNIIKLNSKESPNFIYDGISETEEKFNLLITSPLNNPLNGFVIDSNNKTYEFIIKENKNDFSITNLSCNNETKCHIQFNEILNDTIIFIIILDYLNEVKKIDKSSNNETACNFYFDLNYHQNNIYKSIIKISGFRNSFTYEIEKLSNINESYAKYIPKENYITNYVDAKEYQNKEYKIEILNPLELYNSNKNHYYYLYVHFLENSLNNISPYNLNIENISKDTFNFTILNENKQGILGFNKEIFENTIYQIDTKQEINNNLIVIIKKCNNYSYGLKIMFYENLLKSKLFEDNKELLIVEKFQNYGINTQIEGIFDLNSDEYTGMHISYIFNDNNKYESYKNKINNYRQIEHNEKMITIIKITNKKVKIQWDKVENAKNYEVYIVKDKSISYSYINNECFLLVNQNNTEYFIDKNINISYNEEYIFEYKDKIDENENISLTVGLVVNIEDEFNLRLNFHQSFVITEENNPNISKVTIIISLCFIGLLIIIIFIFFIICRFKKKNSKNISNTIPQNDFSLLNTPSSEENQSNTISNMNGYSSNGNTNYENSNYTSISKNIIYVDNNVSNIENKSSNFIDTIPENDKSNYSNNCKENKN